MRGALVLPLLLCWTASAAAQPVELEVEQPPMPTHWKAASGVGGGAGPVTDAMLRAGTADPSRWLHYHGDYRGHRHSPLESLDPAGAKRLQVAWLLPTGTEGQFEVSPVVYDGIVYVTTSYNRLFALDARTGEVLWRYDHPQPDDLRLCCGPPNRGVAIAGDLVFMATLDAQLLAFRRRTGEIAWQSRIAEPADGYSATGAPLVVGNRVFIGVGGGEFGVRGFFDAYDAASGERLWRHYTIPAEGEPGVETWAGDSWKRGGAPTWTTGAYDAETDTLFWTTGNPSPDWNGEARKGDNLFSDSVLAVDPATGERKWHFQFTPHDVWDFDGNTHLFLVDLALDGKPAKVLAQPNRNGYLYLLDRRDGRFLRATPYVERLNWATIDATGRPVVDPARTPQTELSDSVCPGSLGGMNGSWTGAFDPRLGLAFVPTVEACMGFQKGEAVFIEGLPFLGGTPVNVDMLEGRATSHLSAIDLATGEVRWRHRSPTMGGVLSTAGGVVFSGTLDGRALALDAKTGELIWSFRLGAGVRSQPVAWELDGRPYLAIGAGQLAGSSRWVGASGIVPEGGVLVVFTVPPE